MDVVAWIVQRNQSTVFGQDKEGRTPLFFAAVAKDGGEGFSLLLRNGADPQHVDKVCVCVCVCVCGRRTIKDG